jgi:PTS system nitrogen regulatory IIA component
MNIGELLDNGSIAPRVSAASKRQALSVIAEIAARTLSLKAPQVFDALMEREASAPTGIGHGVAAPHARLEGLERMRGVFVRLEAPVEFGSVDEQPVDLLFALLAPPDSGSEHLRALAQLSRTFRQADFREQLRRARGADAIRALLAREARPSAA